MNIVDFPIVSSIIPADPILTVERDESGMPIRYCIDAHTEGIMQNQRVLHMSLSGPAILYAAWNMNPQIEVWKRIGIGVLGLACMYSNFKSYYIVKEAERRK